MTSVFSFKCCSNTNNPDEKVKSAIKMCETLKAGCNQHLVSIRNAVTMLSSRFMVQSSLIRHLNIFSSVECTDSQNRCQFSLALRKQREKHCAILNMLEKGCSLVFSDGVILGNAGSCILHIVAVIAQI